MLIVTDLVISLMRWFVKSILISGMILLDGRLAGYV